MAGHKTVEPHVPADQLLHQTQPHHGQAVDPLEQRRMNAEAHAQRQSIARAERELHEQHRAALEKFYKLRDEWRAEVAAVQDISTRYQEARARLRELEDTRDRRARATEQLKPREVLEEDQLLCDRQAELVARLGAQYEELSARAQPLGTVVGNAKQALLDLGLKVEG